MSPAADPEALYSKSPHYSKLGGRRQNAKLAEPAKDILDKHKIVVSDAKNGAAMEKGTHKRVHTKDYYDDVNQRVADADSSGGKQAMRAELSVF